MIMEQGNCEFNLYNQRLLEWVTDNATYWHHFRISSLCFAGRRHNSGILIGDDPN
jgi:hypothetical protein